MKLELDRPLVIFDLETTGLFPRKDRIIELAAIKVYPDGTEERRCWLMNPTIHIPEETTRIHGIDDETVKECPTFADNAADIFAFFVGCDLGGFNSDRYDIPCLEEEFFRVGLAFASSQRRHVDVQRIYHKMEPRDLSSAVRYYLGRNHDGAHGAEADAAATLEVLKAQFEREDGAYAALPRTVEALDGYLVPHDPLNADRNGILRWRDGDLLVNFGKKKGESLKRLAVNEPQFLRWILKGDFDTEVKAIVKDLLDNCRLPPCPPEAQKRG